MDVLISASMIIFFTNAGPSDRIFYFPYIGYGIVFCR